MSSSTRPRIAVFLIQCRTRSALTNSATMHHRVTLWIEMFLTGSFVPNDLFMTEMTNLHIVTGPNSVQCAPTPLSPSHPRTQSWSSLLAPFCSFSQLTPEWKKHVSANCWCPYYSRPRRLFWYSRYRVATMYIYMRVGENIYIRKTSQNSPWSGCNGNPSTDTHTHVVPARFASFRLTDAIFTSTLFVITVKMPAFLRTRHLVPSPAVSVSTPYRTTLTQACARPIKGMTLGDNMERNLSTFSTEVARVTPYLSLSDDIGAVATATQHNLRPHHQ